MIAQKIILIRFRGSKIM